MPNKKDYTGLIDVIGSPFTIPAYREPTINLEDLSIKGLQSIIADCEKIEAMSRDEEPGQWNPLLIERVRAFKEQAKALRPKC